jgi:alpha-tubulin suppressor-like RCC1 family protein
MYLVVLLVSTIQSFQHVLDNRDYFLTFSDDGGLLCFGDNRSGALGIIDAQTNQPLRELVPTPTKIEPKHFNNEGIQKVACGYYYSMVLTKKGKLYGTGQNHQSQLGIIGEDIVTKFTPIMFNTGENIVDISCGLKHSLALTSCGKVYGMLFNV